MDALVQQPRSFTQSSGHGTTMASIFPQPSPCVPPFKTLLIHGPYHPSAPLHLCLSHAALVPTNRALFIAPSRAKLQTTLREFSDEWLNERGGHGLTSQSAMRVQMLFVLFHDFASTFLFSVCALGILPLLFTLRWF